MLELNNRIESNVGSTRTREMICSEISNTNQEKMFQATTARVDSTIPAMWNPKSTTC